jgi:hypothetical protein
MAIRIIEQVPFYLPHAHLYLDDIEEISAILREASFKSAKAATDNTNSKVMSGVSDPDQVRKLLGPEKPIETRISYTSGQSKMDSIADLETLGGNTANLTIEVESLYWSISLSLSRGSNPSISLYSLKEEDQWATFGKIKAVFDRRQLRIKNAIENLPQWLKFLPLAFFILSPLFITLINYRSKLSLAIDFAVPLSIVAAVMYQDILNPSRVYFVRSHVRSRASSESRRQTAREIIFLVIGAVIGGLITESIHHFLFKQP